LLKLGKDESFFDLLESQATTAVKAAQCFAALVGNLDQVAAQAQSQALTRIEQEGDDLTHRLQNKLSATFITPLDQEDLSGLSHLLDDITDHIESAGARIEIFRLKECRPDFLPFAAKLVEVTQATLGAVAELHGQFTRSDSLPDLLQRIHDLENESDVIYRTALGRLFDETQEAITILKWKEVYERVEHAIDKCGSIANVIENMIVKYA